MTDGAEVARGTNPLLNDGDGLTNGQKVSLHTNLLLVDSNGDAVNNAQDAFPLHACEWVDTDGDG